MNKFSLWDLWITTDVKVNRVDGRSHKGHIICVDEGAEELGDDGIMVTVENSEGIWGHMAKNIESIIIYENGNQTYKITKENNTWQKTALTQ